MDLRRSPARGLLAALLVAAASACGGSAADTGYVGDGDTGAAAPATTRDMSATPNVGDSTTGITPLPGDYPTGTPSGDTLPRARGTGAATGGAAGAAGGATGTQTPRP